MLAANHAGGLVVSWSLDFDLQNLGEILARSSRADGDGASASFALLKASS